MIRNICYANARQYLALPETEENGDKPRKRTARSNGEPALKRTR